MLIKPLLNILRHNSSLESVESCSIVLTTDRVKISFQCKHGIKKLHSLHYEEVDAVSAVYSQDDCRNKWTVSPRTMSEWILHFQSNLEEVSILHSRGDVLFKSFSQDIVDMDQGTWVIHNKQGSSAVSLLPWQLTRQTLTSITLYKPPKSPSG